MLKILSISVVSLFLLITVVGLTKYDDLQYQPSVTATPVNVDQADAIERLSQAIQIETISHDNLSDFNGESFERFARFLADSFPLVNQKAKRTLINDYSIVYKFDGTNPDLKPVLFMGHMDVVSVDAITLDKWTHPPFSGVVENDIVYGRGAIDDKSTVMSLMEAMELTLKQEQKLERTVYFSFGHDEEVGGKSGAQAIAAYFEQQAINFEFVLDEGGVILKKGMMPNIDKEVAIIGIAEKGFVNIRLTVEQTGGHSSTPPPHTGPGILAKAIVKLENNPFPTDLTFTNMTFNKLGYYADASAKIAMGNQWLTAPVIEHVLLGNSKTAASIRTTTAVTMLTGSSKSNVLPTESTAVVNFRIMPGETFDSVREHVEKIIDDPQVKLEVFMESNPSAVSNIDHYGFKLLEQTLREFDDQILVAPYMVQGGTDSKFFYRVSDAIYRFMRVKVDNELLAGMHGIDERIPVEDYIKGVQFFHELIRKAAVEPRSIN